MFGFGAYLRLDPVDRLLFLVQGTVAMALLVSEVFGLVPICAHLALAGIDQITPHPRLVTLQQITQYLV